MPPAWPRSRSLARHLMALGDIPGLKHGDLVAAGPLGGQPGEIEMLVELDTELASLGPAHRADDRTDADNVDGQRLTWRNRLVAFHQGPHGGNIAQSDLGGHAIDAGDRAAHQPLARLADALEALGFDPRRIGQFACILRRHGLAENIALDL